MQNFTATRENETRNLSSAKLKIMISPCRSGSSALLHALSQSSELECVYQHIKMGIREHGIPDYSIYSKVSTDGRIIINKEAIGHSTVQECSFNIFPNDEIVLATEPIFLFREPVATWNSWKIAQWGNIDLFCMAFRHVVDTFFHAMEVGAKVGVVFYDEFAESSKEYMLRRICGHWECQYLDAMLHWDTKFGKDSSVKYGRHTAEYIKTGQHKTLTDSNTLSIADRTIALPDAEIDLLNDRFGEVFERLRGFLPEQGGRI